MKTQAIDLENERLRASWDCFAAEHLATYLSVEEQDQRINTHSILTRALLADTLWPGRFAGLIDEELRFGLVMTWLLQQRKAGVERHDLLRWLSSPDPHPRVPGFIADTAAWLQSSDCPIADYVTEVLMFTDPDRPPWHLFDPAFDTFRGLWSIQLAGLAAERISLLEIACGSGNDFKAIRDFGLAEHVAYSGLDISWKNIANARDRFRGVDFFEASILDSGLPSGSFDVIFVHDLLGHLSPEALEVALAEIMRITRREAWLHCHNVADIDHHEVHPFFSYYRNRLSLSGLVASLERAGAADVTIVPISAMLERKFGFTPEYTASAGTLLVRKAA